MVLKYIFNKLNCFSLYFDNRFCANSSDIFYKFNSRIKEVLDYDLCIMVGCNTRVEGSILNLRLRKSVINGGLEVGYIGPFSNFSFPVKHLGLGNKKFIDLIKGKHFFSKEVKKAKRILFIFGSNTFSNNSLLSINNVLSNNLKKNYSINILNMDAGGTGMRDLGFKGLNDLFKTDKFLVFNKINLYINTNLNKNQIDFLSRKDSFSIYCGKHKVKESGKSLLVFPGRAFTEKKVCLMNLEGFLQNTNIAYIDNDGSREEWKIFIAFFEFLGGQFNLGIQKKVSFDDFYSLGSFFKKEYPFLLSLNYYNSPLKYILNSFCLDNISINNNQRVLYKKQLKNFYISNISSLKSKVLGSLVSYSACRVITNQRYQYS